MLKGIIIAFRFRHILYLFSKGLATGSHKHINALVSIICTDAILHNRHQRHERTTRAQPYWRRIFSTWPMSRHARRPRQRAQLTFTITAQYNVDAHANMLQIGASVRERGGYERERRTANVRGAGEIAAARHTCRTCPPRIVSFYWF